MKKIFSIFLALIITSLSFTSCIKSDNTIDKDPNKITTDYSEEAPKISFTRESLISPLSFKENPKGYVILDVRKLEDYQLGHINHAVSAPYTKFIQNEDNTMPLPSNKLSEVIGSLGVEKNSKVIVYDDNASRGLAGKVAYILKSCGAENVYILDGGFDYYKSLGCKVSEASTKTKPVTFKSKFNNSMAVNMKFLKNHIDNVKIIDVRNINEFSNGHIPNAKNINFNEFFSKNGMVKLTSEIESLLKANGIVNKNDVIVVYDSNGIKSTEAAVILNIAGYKNVKTYVGSFDQWRADETNKIIK